MTVPLCPRCERWRIKCKSVEQCDEALASEADEAKAAVDKAESALADADDWVADVAARKAKPWRPDDWR